ncbi:glycosyltransferase [Roseateles cellulosilyticus]|uniref:Glycosyltransferase family 4 protein n=1 Tax=Pelomonas cellulosilytica TaxID=2906762 RepID=A0ABS8Y452_9BURK|nr:glycosyltransferase [Pelomonas sp. P8]MCE4558046.1 glycosyltransferase family 4 protein [Pelomonas sp. P8]
MKILFINTYDPATEKHGGGAVSRSELKALQEMAEVETLFGAPLAVRRHQLSYTRLALEVLAGKSLKLASYRVLHRPPSFFADFDLIWCNHDYSAYDHQTFEALCIPYIVRKHNAEHKLVTGSDVLSRLERQRIARFEERIARAAEATLHISSTEYADDHVSQRKSWLPPLLEEPLQFARTAVPYDWRSRPIDLLCVSNFNWPPNKQGIEWFLSQVMDRLPASYTLHLVGAGSERYQRAGRVIGHGFVPDLSGMLASAKLFVAPVLSGAGVKIKNVTAMAAGLPLLTTTCGMEGIQDPAAAPVACVADGADHFVREVTRVLSNEAVCTALSRQSLAWAHSHLISLETWRSRASDAIELALSSRRTRP